MRKYVVEAGAVAASGAALGFGANVLLPHYDPAIKSEETIKACAKALGQQARDSFFIPDDCRGVSTFPFKRATQHAIDAQGSPTNIPANLYHLPAGPTFYEHQMRFRHERIADDGRLQWGFPVGGAVGALILAGSVATLRHPKLPPHEHIPENLANSA